MWHGGIYEKLYLPVVEIFHWGSRYQGLTLLDNSPVTLQLHSYKYSHIGTSKMANV